MSMEIGEVKSLGVEERLFSVMAEFVQDWGLDVPITSGTRLVADLGFDSIDVIQLVVAIETAFNSRNLGFQDLLMQNGRYVDDLSAGEISSFLEARLRRRS